MHGTFATVDGRPVLQFKRRTFQSIYGVWPAVTEPAELPHWFPASVTVDLRLGGKMTFVFPGTALPDMVGEVIEFDQPRRFAFLWGQEQIGFELAPSVDDGGCLYVFTHVLTSGDQAAREAAGWHVCLDALERHLVADLALPASAPSTGPTSTWRILYDEYVRRGLPSGAPVPG